METKNFLQVYLTEVAENSGDPVMIDGREVPVTNVLISQTELSCVVPATVIATGDFNLTDSEINTVSTTLGKAL